MKERGKAFDSYSFNNYKDMSYSSSNVEYCKKHPFSSPVGICADCLKDRLINLVCSECGEQRFSSCSCPDASPYRKSCTGEIGSVGRISFLIENEKKTADNSADEVILLRRSSSSCVGIKKSKNGFWKVKRLFRKKNEKGPSGKDTSFMGVSRSSRSLCSFRVGGLNDADDQSSDYGFSSAKISDVTGSILLDSNKPHGFNEIKPRKSGFRGLSNAEYESRKSGFRGTLELNRVNSVPHWSVFPVKESDFSAMDESAFIDLNLDLSLESKTEFSATRISAASGHDCILRREVYEEPGITFKNAKKSGFSSSCRIKLNDKEIKNGSKGHKVWKWIFRQNFSWRSASKRDEYDILKA